MKRKRVIIGLLGTKLDHVSGRKDRWTRWRPTVAACQQPDLIVDRLELLHDSRHASLAELVAGDIESISPETTARRHLIKMDDPWEFESVYASLHSFAQSYPFDTDREEYLVHITTGSHVAQICLFLLTESRHFPASLFQTSPPPPAKRPPRGRAPVTENPAGVFRVIDLDLSKYDLLATRFQQEHDDSQSLLKAGIATRDNDFNALIGRIEQVTLATRSPICLSGPTGAGKTQLAKRIYQLKRQRQQVRGALVEINCATLRGDGAMSTLFGHKKGAFTGAVADRDGLLKASDGGVLFLDEIGELGRDEQAMLLRAIEEKTFLPVGSDRSVTSDFQLIAGTNRDLVAEVQNGHFREDLHARINLWAFRLPGLSERRADIDPNLDFELARFAEREGRKVTINREARQYFLDFAMDPSSSWTGSFRDLNAAVTRMATLATSGRITVELVKEEIERLRLAWGHDRSSPSPSNSNSVADELLQQVLATSQVESLDRFDRVQLADVIAVCRRSKSLSAAGRELFEVSRKAKQRPNDADRLRKYLRKFGLSWDQIT